MFHFQEKGKSKYLLMDYMGGSHQTGIICILENTDEINRFKSTVPALKDIEYHAEDNPLLVFIEFNLS